MSHRERAPRARPSSPLLRCLTLAWATLLLSACAAAPPARAPASQVPLETGGETIAAAPPVAIPFRLPCGDDDVEACTKGCEDEVLEDCVTLATMILRGEGLPRDAERATSMMRAACDEGSARGCIRLADAYRDGVRDDPTEETMLYRRACDGGANLGCLAAGRSYAAGRGVEANTAESAHLFRRACARGNPPACFELGKLYDAGDGVERDAAKAFDLFVKSCQLGFDEGCLYAGRTEEVLPPRE